MYSRNNIGLFASDGLVSKEMLASGILEWIYVVV